MKGRCTSFGAKQKGSEGVKFNHTEIPMEKMVAALEKINPRSDWEEILQQAAAVLAGIALENKRLYSHLQVAFTAEESREGHCPVCGAKLDYDEEGIELLEDGRASEYWKCSKCGSNGYEYRKTTFDGHVVKVLTNKGHQHLMGQQPKE